jgi:mercuric ion transport protein
MKNRVRNRTTQIGLLAAIAASLCCITPLLVLVAGIGGIVSSFSWIGPIRPVLIMLSFLFLGIAWINQFKSVSCDCNETRWQQFKSSKTFLLIITILALVFTSFPYYSNEFFPKTETKAFTMSNLEHLSLGVTGMTCEGCKVLINQTLMKQSGIQSAQSDFKKGIAEVIFDPLTITPDSILSIINKTGYKAEIIKEQKHAKEPKN